MTGMRQRPMAALSGQAIPTGRKEAIELPESRAAWEFTQAGKLSRGCKKD